MKPARHDGEANQELAQIRIEIDEDFEEDLHEG
jgi:hypothetical protein